MQYSIFVKYSIRQTINRFSCFATFIQSKNILFIYLFTNFSSVLSTFYFLIVRHDLDIVLIFLFMRLFRQRFHVRYNCFQNFSTHLSNSSKSFFSLQMIFANRTNSRYLCKTKSTIRTNSSNRTTFNSEFDCSNSRECHEFLTKHLKEIDTTTNRRSSSRKKTSKSRKNQNKNVCL